MVHTRSKSADQNNGQSVTLWHDLEKNKYYRINNHTGSKKEVRNTGDFIQQFDSRVTGNKNFKERMEFSKDREEYKPHIPSSTKFNFKIAYYNPLPEKYDGYSQFRCPRGVPWDNQILRADKKMNPTTIKKWIEYGKTSLEPRSPRNATLWKNQRKFYEHLTASINKYEQLRSRSPEFSLQELDRSHLIPPNTNLLEKSINKIKMKEKEENKKKAVQESMKKKNIQVNITVSRYSSKISNTENKIVSFPTNFRETQNLIRSYIETKANESLNLSEIAQNLEKYKTKTFRKSLAFRKTSFDMNAHASLKTEKEFLARIDQERDEMRGYLSPPEKVRKSIITKGRFGTMIDTEGLRYNKDRKLMKTINPELYTEEVNKPVQMRRKALDFLKASDNAPN